MRLTSLCPQLENQHPRLDNPYYQHSQPGNYYVQPDYHYQPGSQHLQPGSHYPEPDVQYPNTNTVNMDGQRDALFNNEYSGPASHTSYGDHFLHSSAPDFPYPNSTSPPMHPTMGEQMLMGMGASMPAVGHTWHPRAGSSSTAPQPVSSGMNGSNFPSQQTSDSPYGGVKSTLPISPAPADAGSPGEGSSQGRLHCAYCNKPFTESRNRQRHEDYHCRVEGRIPPKSFRCPFPNCDQRPTRGTHMKDHLRKVHHQEEK